MKRMAIINLHGKLGMFHYAFHLANALAASSAFHAKVTVLLPSYSPAEVFDPRITRVTLVASHSAKHFLWQTFLPQNWWNFFRVVQQNQSIHFVDNHPWMFIMLPLCRLWSREIYVTIHDITPHTGESNFFFRMLQRGITKLSFVVANKVVLHSEVFLKSLPERLHSKVVIVPHGVFFQFPATVVPKEKNPNRVLFFGRIRDYKGLALLVAAWQKVEVAGKQLCIAGEGKIEPELQQVIHNDSSIILENRFIADEEIAGFFEESSILVLPYKNATQSGPLLLAYNYELPVIVTRVGALPEYVEEGRTGFVIERENEDALAKVLAEYLQKTNQEKQQMGKAAREKALKEYSWEAIVRKIYQD